MRERVTEPNPLTTAEIIKAVPAYKEFFTFDELQNSSRRLKERFPDIVRSEIVGHSSEGRPIELLKIGNGRRKAFWFGTPHPNEPIGTLTLEVLTEQLCSNPSVLETFDTTFLIIKSADPDGMVLNEGWFKREAGEDFSPLKYALNFYRPQFSEQVEWSFPIEYEKDVKFDTTLPETQAIMKVIEDYQPEFMYSLHNSALSGAYFHLSQPIEALYPQLQQIINKNNVPLDQGIAEEPQIEKWATAIFGPSLAVDRYNYLKASNTLVSAVSGASSLECLRRYVKDPLVIICEVPYFSSPTLSDNTPTSTSLREAIYEGIGHTEGIANLIRTHLDALDSKLPDSSLLRSASWFPRYVSLSRAAQKNSLDNPNFERPATVAEKFFEMVGRKFYGSLFLGEVYRLAKMAGDEKRAEEIYEALESIMTDIQENSPIHPLSLQQLVRIQLESGLTAMQYAKTKD